VFDDADVVLVDLNAELPSYCARPHVQQAAFIARHQAVYNDIEGRVRVRRANADVDPLCVAHISLRFNGAARFYKPRKVAATLYPRATKMCSQCLTKRPDMNSDYLLLQESEWTSQTGWVSRRVLVRLPHEYRGCPNTGLQPTAVGGCGRRG